MSVYTGLLFEMKILPAPASPQMPLEEATTRAENALISLRFSDAGGKREGAWGEIGRELGGK